MPLRRLLNTFTLPSPSRPSYEDVVMTDATMHSPPFSSSPLRWFHIAEKASSWSIRTRLTATADFVYESEGHV